MEYADMPFVAVIGGLWQLDQTQAAAAQATGKVIGAKLAKAGFGLLVYFSDEASLEPHVVSGYAATLTDGAGAIRVRYAESQRGQVKFDEETARPELFEHCLFLGQDWEAPFYRSLVEEEGVDAVLLLGGATSTYIAGQIAVARRLPILAVDEFGGSGLIAAGATGTLVRAVLSGSGENDPRTSLLLGSIAGFVVGLAYLIPQWVGAPGVLAPKVETVSATDKIQFASAVLVAVSAGVGFDTVFSRLQKQAQDAAVSPPQ